MSISLGSRCVRPHACRATLASRFGSGSGLAQPHGRPLRREPRGIQADTRTRATVHSVGQMLLAQLGAAHPGLQAGFAFNSAVFLLGIKVLLSGLSPTGVAHAWFLGGSVFAAFGWSGYLLVCLYFLIGTAATKIKFKEKDAAGIAEKGNGRRGPASVWGSSIAGVLCAWGAIVTGNYDLFQLGFVASFCSKLSDTVSSEIGKAYGKTTYLITTMRLVPAGTEGAVSAEGTLAGVAAALGFSVLALVIGQVDLQGALICACAATAANIFESWIGASSQGKVEWLTNDTVNMIQICAAAALACTAKYILS